MESIFLVQEEDLMKNFLKQNPTGEDFYDIVGENDPEFLLKSQSYLNSITENSNVLENDLEEDCQDEMDRYNFDLPFGYHEIELYDNQKTFDENFEKGNSKKYILIEIDKQKHFTIKNPESILPTPQSKCLIDIEKVEDYSSLEILPVDYDSFFGLRLLSFEKYKSDYFLCDERVMFETLVIKYQRFGFKPFFWSKEVIFEELGIKKDRATKIIQKFIDLGIVSKKLQKSIIDNRPMQINFYDLNPEKIIELIPKIYQERDSISLKTEIEKYLYPALKKK